MPRTGVRPRLRRTSATHVLSEHAAPRPSACARACNRGLRSGSRTPSSPPPQQQPSPPPHIARGAAAAADAAAALAAAAPQLCGRRVRYIWRRDAVLPAPCAMCAAPRNSSSSCMSACSCGWRFATDTKSSSVRRSLASNSSRPQRAVGQGRKRPETAAIAAGDAARGHCMSAKCTASSQLSTHAADGVRSFSELNPSAESAAALGLRAWNGHAPLSWPPHVSSQSSLSSLQPLPPLATLPPSHQRRAPMPASACLPPACMPAVSINSKISTPTDHQSPAVPSSPPSRRAGDMYSSEPPGRCSARLLTVRTSQPVAPRWGASLGTMKPAMPKSPSSSWPAGPIRKLLGCTSRWRTPAAWHLRTELMTCTINAAVSASGCSRSSADPAAAAAARLRMYSSRSPSISGICSTTAASPGLSLMASSSVLQLLAPPPSLLRSCELTRVAKASCTVRIDGSSDSAMWMCASRTAALSSDSPSPAAASAAVRAEQHLPAPGATAAGLAAAAERLPATAPPNDPGGAAGSQLRSDISFMAHGRPWRSCAVSMRPCELQMWRPRASLSNSSSRSLKVMPAAQSGIDAQESLRVKHTPPQPPLPPARLRRPTPRARRRSAAAAVASAGREGGSLALSGAKPVGVGSGDSRRGGLLGGRTRKQSRKGSGHACRRGCGCCGWDAAASSNASAASKNGSSPESARASGGGGAPSAACCMVAAAGLAGDRRAFQAASRWPLLARPLRPRCRVNARPRPRIASEKGAQKGICALACQGQVLQRVGWISFGQK
mmetsp:Transcript_7721/g.23188  ORF Transcript_7721/g.23188 Transcript_7721/m.23188 type:complete len:778 (+) Transcript_7721:1309-3642(+)